LEWKRFTLSVVVKMILILDQLGISVEYFSESWWKFLFSYCTYEWFEYKFMSVIIIINLFHLILKHVIVDLCRHVLIVELKVILSNEKTRCELITNHKDAHFSFVGYHNLWKLAQVIKNITINERRFNVVTIEHPLWVAEEQERLMIIR